MLKDNQLSSVLLLVALGFLIYVLTKPKTVSEGFAEEEKTKNTISKLVETEIKPVVEVKTEVLKQILAEAEAETPKVEIQGDQLDVFQFEPNDIQESGADLDNAFQRPIPQQARPDVVDINKNNVKKYNAKDFLPKEINNQWFDTDFSQAKFNINDDKLINTERYVIGINTVGQSLKNASYDIRGTIPNPKFTVSPWNNSTYEPDFNLKPLC
jgi:hypothetical protein